MFHLSDAGTTIPLQAALVENYETAQAANSGPSCDNIR